MNRFQPKKLLLSKWTAVKPVKKQKHFIVVNCLLDEETQKVLSCTLEAVMTKHHLELTPNSLKDSTTWLQGWQ